MSGSFKIIIDDGQGDEREITLNRSDMGLYVPPLTWRQIRQFSTNSVALILASLPYSTEDYIYDYKEFSELRNAT